MAYRIDFQTTKIFTTWIEASSEEEAKSIFEKQRSLMRFIIDSNVDPVTVVSPGGEEGSHLRIKELEYTEHTP